MVQSAKKVAYYSRATARAHVGAVALSWCHILQRGVLHF